MSSGQSLAALQNGPNKVLQDRTESRQYTLSTVFTRNTNAYLISLWHFCRIERLPLRSFPQSLVHLPVVNAQRTDSDQTACISNRNAFTPFTAKHAHLSNSQSENPKASVSPMV